MTEEIESEILAHVRREALHDWADRPHVDFSKLTSDQMRMILLDCATASARRTMRLLGNERTGE